MFEKKKEIINYGSVSGRQFKTNETSVNIERNIYNTR